MQINVMRRDTLDYQIREINASTIKCQTAWM